jgi:uncharacterized protein (DUF1330 family)
MSCYFIAQINVKDPTVYQKYLDGFDDVLNDYEGEVVSVDDDVAVLEGKWPFKRTVIIRFVDEAEAKRWYESDEYKAIMKFRRRASHSNIILAEGRN